MEHELEVEIISELLEQLDDQRNVDAGVQYRCTTDAYVDADIAEREWESFFQNHPQLIGLSGDLAEPNTFFTNDYVGTPILATRDQNGTFRAYLNACRHRGTRLVSESRGSARRFTCPFHSWTYSPAGELVGIPQEDHFGEVDRDCNRLIGLPAIEHNGLLWVHPKPDGKIDLDTLLGKLGSEMASGDYARYQYAGESIIPMRLNWKLANDTFGETYHFQKLHKNTLGQLFYGDALAYETIQKNHRFVFPSKAIDDMREIPQSEWSLDSSCNLLYYLFPNIQFNVGLNGYLALIKIYPDPESPSRSITHVSHYFTPEVLAAALTAEGDVIDAENVYQSAGNTDALRTLDSVKEVFRSTIEQEDYLMGEGIQRSVESGLLSEVIFGRNEPALHHYHNTFRATLNLPPLKQIQS